MLCCSSRGLPNILCPLFLLVSGSDRHLHEQHQETEQQQQQQQHEQPQPTQQQHQQQQKQKAPKPALGGLKLAVGSQMPTGEWKSNGVWIKKENNDDEAPSNLQVIAADDLIKVKPTWQLESGSAGHCVKADTCSQHYRNRSPLLCAALVSPCCLVHEHGLSQPCCMSHCESS